MQRGLHRGGLAERCCELLRGRSIAGLEAFSVPGTPVSSALPTICGFAEQGQTLTATHGEWSNSPTSLSEQWARCNAAGYGCAAIFAATGSTYTVAATDAGSTIRVQESAVNANGAGAPAASTQTGNVASNVPAGSVSFVSSSRLKATVPWGAGTGTITVTNASPPVGTVSSAGSFVVSP